MKSAFAANLEYFALRAISGAVNALPYGAAMRLAEEFALFASRVLRFKRRRTLERIRSVFPDKSDRERVFIAERSLVNMFWTAVEMIRAPKLTCAWMDEHIEDGELYKQKLQALVNEGKGVVIMVPHSANWYMAAWSMAKYGLKLFALAARQRNPKLDAWMNRQYGDIEVLDRDNRDTVRVIEEKLAAGRAFAILPDLRVRKPDVEADFFGGKANVSRAGALFAVKCGAPIVVAIMSRKNGKHVFNHLATLRPDANAADRNAEARRLTGEALKLLSDAIMREPENWFWYNKRWILEPPEKRKERS